MRNTKSSRSTTLLRSLLSEIYLGLGGKSSPHLSNLIKSNSRQDDVSIIAIESPDPNGYDDWRDFYRDYCVASLASKLDCLDLGVNRADVALKKFLLCEDSCHELNKRFAHADSDPFLDSDVRQVFHLARRKISRVLGRFDWDEATAVAAFGPGAAVGVKRQRCHMVDKFGLERPTVTGECAALAEVFIKTSPQWSTTVPVTSGRIEDHFEIVRGSRVTTVPKSAKTDRVIAVEPLLNMFFQKGIGAVIRRRLRTVGVNLDDQLRNQSLARKGSLSGLLATIDLSSASDSISRGLVDWLCPEDWLTALKSCRSVWCTLPSGEEKFLQKFSSMGNGYTFELESLIFWAFCSSCIQFCGESARDLGVYGDDLIVPAGNVSDLLIRCLDFAGFKTNAEKTFVSGPFRESCGKHFFLGRDVTPLYIRKDASEVERLLWLANSLRRLAHRFIGVGYGCCDSLKPAYDLVVRSLPVSLKKLSIPEGFGDGGLVRNFDECTPRRHRCFDAFVTKHVRRDYSTFQACNQPALTTSLFLLERRKGERISITRSKIGQLSLNVQDVVPLEKPTSRYKLRVVKLVVNRWSELGPWTSGFN